MRINFAFKSKIQARWVSPWPWCDPWW